MYIACPKCDTNFVISSDQIGLYGRKVRCSKCENIWHQKSKEPIIPESVISLPLATPNRNTRLTTGTNLPALVPVKIPVYPYGLPIILTILIIALLVILFQGVLGIKSADVIRTYIIKDLHAENLKDSNKIVITYKIINSSDQVQLMPLVRVRLLDKDNRALKSYVEDKIKDVLEPNQSFSIKTVFTSSPKNTSKVDIMLGNLLDFALQ